MKKFLSVALALAMTLSLVVVGASAKSFTDSSKVNYKEAVDVISACKVIDGYTDGSFAPTNTLTRGAAAKIICNMMLGPTTASALGVSTAPFKDVSASNVFAGYIAYCSSKGIISGYADKTFRPAGTVTGYQFLKMLLGALGYDSTIEGFTGSNWEVNVAKLASNLGLYDGNDGFVGTKAMTREEACLYAFNTLQSNVVEYETKGTTITINGVTIAQGASKASTVTRTSGTDYATGVTANVGAPDTVQFCEQYFKNLTKVPSANSDAFCRPATTWKYGTTTVGTYPIAADKTYTTSVDMNTVYTDLGLSATVTAANTEVYVDGVSNATQTAYDIARGDTTNYFGGRGVKTEVYNNYPTTGKVTVVEMNTYVGDVTAVAAKTTAKDRSITVATRKGTSGSFTTDSFAIDDAVLYTYSNKVGSVGIQSVEAAKTVTGTVTAYTTDSNVTVGGTTYKYAKQCANTANDVTLNSQVTLTLDQYGNVIDVAAVSSTTTYAVVLKYTDATSWDNAKARLLFTDGSTKDVELTANVAKLAGGAENVNDVLSGSIVTYTVNTKGLYTLTVKTEPVTVVSKTLTTNNSSDLTGITASLVGNGSTIFLVKTMSNGDPVYTAYIGIKNVPTIASPAAAANNVTCYTKTKDLATVVYIDATASGTSINNSTSNTNAIFVKADSISGKIVDAVKGTYYNYDAVVNGQITTLSLAAKSDGTAPILGTDPDALYTSISYDSNKIATVTNIVSGTTGINNGTGTVKAANEVIGLNGSYYSYAKDCQVFFVDTDGNITASSVASIATDATDKVFARITDGVVTTIVVHQVNSSDAGLTVKVAAGNSAGYATTTNTWTGTGTAADPYTQALTFNSGVAAANAITYTLTPAAGATVVTLVTAPTTTAAAGTLAATALKYSVTAENGTVLYYTVNLTITEA